MKSLFESVQLGSLVLANRVFMAPTYAEPRQSQMACIANSLRHTTRSVLRQDSSLRRRRRFPQWERGTLILRAFIRLEQIHAWRKIVDAVHGQNGRIFLQLWHVGRISHSSLLPNNAQPVAPSAIRANSHTSIATGRAQVSEPVALTASGIKETLADYRRAADNAKEAGFDGVEIHAANGYLIDQFLQTGTNQRIDEYGGSVANRIRFLSEAVADCFLEVWDPRALGCGCPRRGTFNDMSDKDPESTFMAAVATMSRSGLGISPRRGSVAGRNAPPSPEFASLFARMRHSWHSVYVANGGFDGLSGEEAVKAAGPTQSPMGDISSPTPIYQGGCNSEPP